MTIMNTDCLKIIKSSQIPKLLYWSCNSNQITKTLAYLRKHVIGKDTKLKISKKYTINLGRISQQTRNEAVTVGKRI